MRKSDVATGADRQRVTTDKLVADLRVLAADVEELLKATAGQTGQHVADVRARAEESLDAVKARIIVLQDGAVARSRAAGRATDAYVHANPWQGMAVCAVAGLALGSLLARSGSSDA